MTAGTTDRLRRPAVAVARNFWGRLRAPRSLAEQRERLITPEELNRIKPAH
ncbi:MAG: hypothetical protein QM774_11000 [Gordonia sp. (in: high G+C Gram-positive bacteria)]|uniref:hypothetical protein n=1 Tax=Gordonia sp. (in: high G+C Gram-positive bacteria) TaxID=84139 RepID=UPI0039E5559A